MKIAVFLPNWIGDAVMATPALRALRQHFPQAHLIAVARPYVAAVLDGAPWFDEQILFDPRRWWQTAWRLWQARQFVLSYQKTRDEGSRQDGSTPGGVQVCGRKRGGRVPGARPGVSARRASGERAEPDTSRASDIATCR